MAEENKPSHKPSIFGGVDFHCADNNKEHHTDEVLQERLVVRRGQKFKITLTLTQSFNPQLQQLIFTAKTGDKHASEDMGTLSIFGYPDNIKRSPSAKAVWKAELLTSLPSNTVALSITPPANAPVGEYELFGKLQEEEKSLGKLVVLFNPWCSEDSVHLSDDPKRQEYVLNEHGIIYKGTEYYISDTDWDYGQFEENMVDICLKILDRNHKHEEDPAEDVASRSDPIYVSRVISAMINAQDDSGVLVGRWVCPYWDGERPTHWTGSYPILKQWFQSGCKPVKYGQCWVFAGVMCSVMRLLGIPCRVVTNFNSAHDTDMNLLIDIYIDDDGVDRERTNDSIWNFHVWTEGWMKRPDLGSNGAWDDWQVLDPTPQETSDGVYCCGPASVKSILNGHTEFKYDTPFVFAEVNADRVYWTITESGEKVQTKSDTQNVGKCISTKAVGSREREDITDTYKPKEGSEKERDCVAFAITRVSSKSDDEIEEYEEEDEVMDMECGSGEADEGAISGETDERAGSGETDERAVSGETNERAGSGETNERAVSGETDERAVSGETNERAVSGETDERAVSGETDERAVSGETDERAVSGETNERAVSGETNERAVSGETNERAGSGGIDGGAVSGETDERAVSGETDERAVSGENNERAVSGETDERAVSGETDERAVSGETNERAVSGETNERAVSGETDGRAVSGETNERAGSGGIDGGAGSGGTEEETTPDPPSPLTIQFKKVSRLINGKDVNLKLVLKSKSDDARPLSIHISVQAMNYNGVPTGKILKEDKEGTLLPGKALSVPILVPFLTYHKPMVESESMKISVMITDKKNGDHKYLAMHDVVLLNPPLSITAPAQASLNKLSSGEVVFMNPVNEILTNCTLTLSGCGLFRVENNAKIEDLKPKHKLRVKFYFIPYKKGEKTLTADFDCDTFRDIKAVCTVNVVE